MATEDPYIICPLDESHQILKSRLQFHLVRCIKNHNLENKQICPYNPLHIIDNIYFKNHVLNCPDLKEVQSFQFNCDDTEIPGLISMTEVLNAEKAIVGEENWDNDSHPTYDPLKNIAEKPVIQTLIGASKSKRREFKMKERMRMAQFDTEPMTAPIKNPEEPMKGLLMPLRPPRSKLAAALAPRVAPDREVNSTVKDSMEMKSTGKEEDRYNLEANSFEMTKGKPNLCEKPVNPLKNDKTAPANSNINSELSTNVVNIEESMEKLEIVSHTSTEPGELMKTSAAGSSGSQTSGYDEDQDFTANSGSMSTTSTSPSSSSVTNRGKVHRILWNFAPQPLNLRKTRDNSFTTLTE